MANNELPKQPVAEAPQNSSTPEKPQTEREVRDAAVEETRKGAETALRDEAVKTMMGNNGDGNGGGALDASQERVGSTTSGNELSEAETAEGVTIQNGHKVGADGKYLSGPNVGKPAGGETNPLNTALEIGESGEPTKVNLDLKVEDPPSGRTADANGDGLPDLPEIEPPTPPAELTADAPIAPVAGEKPGTEKEKPGVDPTVESKTQDDYYPEKAASTQVEETPDSKGGKQDSAEVSAMQDGTNGAAPSTPTTAAAVAATPTSSPTLNDAGPGTVARTAVPADTAPVAPTEVATIASPTDAALKPGDSSPELSPEQRAADATKALTEHFAKTPHDAQVRKNLEEFNARTDVTPEQKAKALENLLATAKGEPLEGNNRRSNMSQENLDRAVAGGINDIAKPRAIDQGNNGTCNSTVIQEGVATENPERYTAALREVAIHGTYTGDNGFTALMPSDLMTPHREAQGPQNADGARNFSSQLLQGGMLNNYWQQRGQYYTDTDARGEQRYEFNPNAGSNPFTTNYRGEGANVGANEVGEMGRNFGIKGQFVYAQRDWVTGPVDPSVKIVGSPEELRAAKEQRARETGSDWGIAVVHSGNSLFTGSEGLGGQGGGHVVSTYRNGDLSNQWGGQFDRKGVSESTLFASMSMNPNTRSGDGPQGRGTPAGGGDDATLPDRFKKHYDENPNAHRKSIEPNTPDDTAARDKMKQDAEKDKEKEKEGAKDGEERKKADGGKLNQLNMQKAMLEARIRYASAQIEQGLASTATLDLYNAQIAGIQTEITSQSA